jgi:integrase-like protein
MGDYTSVTKAGAFSGATEFARVAGVNRSEVIDKLRRIPAYALHQPARRRFPRRQVYASGPGQIFGMDLADLGKKRSRNNLKQKYILVMICYFSRKAWIEAIPGKTGPKVSAAIRKILRRCGRKPKRIHCDFGREFYNKVVQKTLEEEGIELYSTTTGMKATIAERFIRTLFGKIQRYLTHNNTNRFVDKLQHFENLYNNSYHRSIGMTPNQVTPETEEKVYGTLYRSRIPKLYKTPKFQVGDSVLAVKSKGVFEKGYTVNYQTAPYTVIQVLDSPERAYMCKRGSQINLFYEAELVTNVMDT